MTLPLTGEQFAISGGGYDAVVTQTGAALRSLSYGERPLVHGFAEDELPQGGAGQTLAPWPNRIKDGRYEFQGAQHQLVLTEPKHSNAIHGLVRWAPFMALEHTADTVTLGARIMAQPGYPWIIDLAIGYRLGADGLTVTVTAVNQSSVPAPFAYGAHPYFTVGGPLDDWRLTVPAHTYLQADERLIPVSAETVSGRLDFTSPRAIGQLVLDHGFVDLVRDADGRARAVLSGPDGALTVWGDQSITCLQVFSGDTLGEPRVSLAIEPMTAEADAFNTDRGLIVLAPGAPVTIRWGVTAS